jgi:hypothetical protein
MATNIYDLLNDDVSNNELFNNDLNDSSKLDMVSLRKNYCNLYRSHRSFFTRDILSSMWESWQNDTTTFPGSYNVKLGQIRLFVINPDQTELILYQRSAKSRFEYHVICNALMLDHRSIEENNNDDGWKIVTYQKTKSNSLESTQKKYEHNKDNKDNKDNSKTKTLIISKPTNWCWEFTSNST